MKTLWSAGRMLLAFAADPVARWMYRDAHRYLAYFRRFIRVRRPKTRLQDYHRCARPFSSTAALRYSKEDNMDMTLPKVAAIVGDTEINHAIASLVLAFVTDLVARWMYHEPDRYVQYIPRLFRALGTSSFEAGAAQRTGDGLGVALWLPPGVAGVHGSLEMIIAESIVKEEQADVGAMFEETERYRPTEPHWYLSLIGVEALHRNKGCGAALLEHGLRQCDREHRHAYLWSSNPQNASLYQRHGFEFSATIQVGSSPSIFPMLRHAR